MNSALPHSAPDRRWRCQAVGKLDIDIYSVDAGALRAVAFFYPLDDAFHMLLMAVYRLGFSDRQTIDDFKTDSQLVRPKEGW